jgi:acyl carrier protein/NADP-dependent 3-hydroxy acid dehydrogenase YdfG
MFVLAVSADLRETIELLQCVCQTHTRILLFSLEPVAELRTTSGGPGCEVMGGAVLSAQLEYLKCSLTVCRVMPGAAPALSLACAEQLVQVVATECGVSMGNVETEVLYAPPTRADGEALVLQRFVRRYEKVPARAASTAVASAVTNAADGVYVITGGLGGLGILTAQCLLQRGVRKIVLLCRSGKVAYQGQGLEKQLDALLAVPHAQVKVVLCDVSVEAEVVRMLAEVRKIGPVVGIVHAAGVLSDGLIVTGKSAQGASAVWAAKAHSAYLLHKHTAEDTQLRMFLCYSSVTAAVGTAGQAAYGAANRYMEWLMQERIRGGHAGLCVRWPEVSGVGMAAALHGADSGNERECSITAAQVERFLLDLFTRAGAEQQTIAVSTVTLMPPALVDLYKHSSVGKQFAHLQPAAGVAPCAEASNVASAPATIQAAPRRPVPTEPQLHTTVRRIVSTLLDDAGDGAAMVSDDALLMQTGLDSLGATELSAQLSGEFKVKVPPTLIFNFPTVKEIVGYLQATLAAQHGAPAPRAILQQSPSMSISPQPACAMPSSAKVVRLEEVAIIGTSLSFPGNCSSLERLWEILVNKESTSVNTPADRWDVDALLASNNIRDATCRARLLNAHFLTHDERFNCLQFNMTAKEAAALHPTHRLLLINCQRALQDAGYEGEKLCANTGVYVGIGGVVSGTGSVAAPATTTTTTTRQPAMSAYSATSHSVSVSYLQLFVSVVRWLNNVICRVTGRCLRVGSRSRWASTGRAWRSTQRARHRWSRSTPPAAHCSSASAIWR